jgi:hypothetical protein
VTDREPDDQWKRFFDEKHIEVICPEHSEIRLCPSN